jgi:hypothetical protein
MKGKWNCNYNLLHCYMDNTNKPNDTTSAAPPIIGGVGSTTPPADTTTPVTPAADSVPAVPVTPETPLVTTPAAGPMADLGSSFNAPVPAPETPKTDTAPSMATSTTPISTESVIAEPTTAGSSVTPPATDDSTTEAHAGMTPPPPVTPPMSTAESSMTDPGYAKTKSNHMVLITVILVIVAFVSVLVLFFYRQYNNLVNPTSSISPTPMAKVVVSPTATPSPTPVNEEERDLQGIKIEEIDTELSNIDKDLTQL